MPLAAEVSVDDDWIVVRRGPAHVDPRSFPLDDVRLDPFGYLRSLPGTVG